MRPRRPSRKLADRRLRILLVVFAIVFAVTLARAAWLQTVQASRLAGKGASQQRETLDVPAGRGTIFDRAGVQLAISVRYGTPAGQRADAVRAAVRAAARSQLGLALDSINIDVTDIHDY